MIIENNAHSTIGRSAKLKAKTVPVSAITSEERARMFDLMHKYYDEVSREQFLKDLSKKDDVIMLLDDEGQIQGFSTLARLSVKIGDKTLRGIFSGDTAIDREFWGQRALGKAFLGYLFKERLKRPLVPLYWLLITKGYKTYLMMANNFTEYYPRLEKGTPANLRAIMDAFYLTLYPDDYDPATGLIHPKGEACHLKAGVANISSALIRANPKVAFFQRINPQWQKGVELACIARMTMKMPLKYALKAFLVDRLMKPISRFVFPISKESRNE